MAQRLHKGWAHHTRINSGAKMQRLALERRRQKILNQLNEALAQNINAPRDLDGGTENTPANAPGGGDSEGTEQNDVIDESVAQALGDEIFTERERATVTQTIDIKDPDTLDVIGEADIERDISISFENEATGRKIVLLFDVDII